MVLSLSTSQIVSVKRLGVDRVELGGQGDFRRIQCGRPVGKFSSGASLLLHLMPKSHSLSFRDCFRPRGDGKVGLLGHGKASLTAHRLFPAIRYMY